MIITIFLGGLKPPNNRPNNAHLFISKFAVGHHYNNLQITVWGYTAHQIFSFSHFVFFVPQEMHVLKNIQEHLCFSVYNYTKFLFSDR